MRLALLIPKKSCCEVNLDIPGAVERPLRSGAERSDSARRGSFAKVVGMTFPCGSEGREGSGTVMETPAPGKAFRRKGDKQGKCPSVLLGRPASISDADESRQKSSPDPKGQRKRRNGVRSKSVAPLGVPFRILIRTCGRFDSRRNIPHRWRRSSMRTSLRSATPSGEEGLPSPLLLARSRQTLWAR